MKIGFVSDTHGNLPAFKKVVEHMDTQGVDIKVHLGDIVGYGPYPNECVEMTLQNFNYIVMGNHDSACVNIEESWGFNPLAKEAIEWTAKNTSEENKAILNSLEYGYSVDKLMFVHGSPADTFDYIFDKSDASRAFSATLVDFDIAFIGHTHVPGVFVNNGSNAISYSRPEQKVGATSAFKLTIPEGKKAIVNVGSVGQPRDNDPRASYAVYDTETKEVTFFKVTYDIDLITGKMQRFGFDSRSIMRLLQGR